MPFPAPCLSTTVTWLSPSDRPSPQEVETYAHLIQAFENHPPESFHSCLREAELQLWSWRNDPAKDPPGRSRKAASRAVKVPERKRHL
jgi:hypothetical protein